MSLYKSDDAPQIVSRREGFAWPSFAELFDIIKNNPVFSILVLVLILWWPILIGGRLFLESSQYNAHHFIQPLSYLIYISIMILFFVPVESGKMTNWLFFLLIGIPVFHLASWLIPFEAVPNIFWAIEAGTASPAFYVTSLLRSEKYLLHETVNYFVYVSTFLLELIFLWILMLFSPRKNSTHSSLGGIGPLRPAYVLAILIVLFIGTASYPAYIKLYAP